MADALFTITCTTCEARLNVRDKSAIGQIVMCPKCGSMVQIVAPAGWQAPEEPAELDQPGPATSSPPAEEPPRAVAEKPEPIPAPAASARVAAISVPPPLAGSTAPLPSTMEERPKKPAAAKIAAAAAGLSAGAAGPAAGSGTPPPTIPPDLPEGPAVFGPPAVEAPPVQPLPDPASPASAPPLTQWASPAEAATRRWLWWSTIPAAGVVVALGVWALLSGGSNQRPQPDRSPKPPVAAADPGAAQVPATVLPEYDDRWVPDRPEFVLSLDIAGSEAAGQLAPLLKAVPPVTQAIMEKLFQGFGLKPNAVQHLTWASSDLSTWSETGVVVITLTPGQSAIRLGAAGTVLAGEVGGVQLRKLARPTWQRAFVVLDERTIVTGEESLLRQLVQRGRKPAELGLLRPLLEVAPADADFFLALDLQAATEAGWPMPADWLDVWPSGRDAWRLVWSLPSALSLSFDRADLALAEVGLLCEGQTVADKVRAALEQWIPQAKSVLAARLDELAAPAGAGGATAESAAGYRLALTGAAAALASAHLEVASQCVWLRADCGKNSPSWTDAAADSRDAIQADWYRAAGKLDATLQSGLHRAIVSYDEAKQAAPAGAINSGPLPPDKVLSWITAMLPYLGHEPWAQDLNPSYSWDSAKNRPVTTRTLDAVQNPAVAVRQTESGFPVTHYVGVAGVGADAADLPRDDRRAGIFGYQKSRRLTDVPDGASNTIATVGVSGQLGSWASGGPATVRGFTRKPYINGPDGFGSGQPGGMCVGMADGSARFLSSSIDPTVLEQLATAAGGESVSPASPPDGQVVGVEPPPPALGPVEPTPSAKEPVASPAAEPAAPEPAEGPGAAEPAPVALSDRLQMPLSGIAITDAPLGQAIRSMEDLGLLQVSFDLDTMSALGVSLDRPVSVRLTGTAVGQALDAILASCGLKPTVRGEQIWVTGVGQASGALRTVRYSAADLISADAASAAELVSWIPRLIAAGTWEGSGGRGTIRENAGVVEITQSETVHLEILGFCERLRVARGLSPRSGQPAERFRLATRRARAAASLEQPVTINFFRPTGLGRILEEVGRAAKVQVAVNWLALAEEEKRPDWPAVLTVSQAPLGTALGQFFEPLGLDYRAIDERTVEVTTRAAAAGHPEREFYPIGDLLDAGEDAGALSERVRGEIAAGTWEADGGKGVVVFDKPSRYLIVFQPQRVQAEVERFLDGLRGGGKAAPAKGAEK